MAALCEIFWINFVSVVGTQKNVVMVVLQNLGIRKTNSDYLVVCDKEKVGNHCFRRFD
jgi:hypothetical protein